MTEPVAAPPDRQPRVFYAEPEALFRVGPIEAEGEHAAGEMLAGRWMRDATGRPIRGSVFVLVDDVFCTAALGYRPEGHWAVTTELSLDFAADAWPADDRPADDRIVAEADLVGHDSVGALARGSVRAPDGRMLAVGASRVRYSQQVPAAYTDPSLAILPHFERSVAAPDGPLEQLLGASFTQGQLVLPPSGLLANSMGPMHGGVLACASELLAVTEARRTSDDFVTTSIHLAFTRPADAAEPVTFTAEPKHAGRSLQVWQVTSRGASGKLCSIAMVTCQVTS